MPIQATTATTIPSATYDTWWIDSINISNKNIQQPSATIRFVLGDAAGNMALGVPAVVYSINIMSKIIAGDTELAGLFGSIISKAGALAIADGKLPATVV